MYDKFKNTLTLNYYYSVLKTKNISKVYKYKNCLEYKLFSDNVSEKFYISVLNNCKKYSYLSKKWKKIIFKIKNNFDPEPWEISGPLFKKSDISFQINESKQIIKRALAIFGTDYLKKIDYLFSSNCIDFMPNVGKRQGAYSFGVWDNKPYICMNWNGKFRDLSTLIHELGHSIHTLYSNENQPQQYSEYPIFLAEIASIVNEVMLINYFLKNNQNVEFKKVILEKLISEFIATVYRQAQFADFELWAHKKVECEQAFNFNDIKQKCEEIDEMYFPKLKTQTKINKYSGLWGIFVPHFYSSFYVYKYIIGMICAFTITSKINEDPNYVNKYLLLLKNGCKNFPLEILKEIDIDLCKDKTYEKAFLLFEDFLVQLEELI